MTKKKLIMLPALHVLLPDVLISSAVADIASVGRILSLMVAVPEGASKTWLFWHMPE